LLQVFTFVEIAFDECAETFGSCRKFCIRDHFSGADLLGRTSDCHVTHVTQINGLDGQDVRAFRFATLVDSKFNGQTGHLAISLLFWRLPILGSQVNEKLN
jgi:hypothetical protein